MSRKKKKKKEKKRENKPRTILRRAKLKDTKKSEIEREEVDRPSLCFRGEEKNSDFSETVINYLAHSEEAKSKYEDLKDFIYYAVQNYVLNDDN